MNQTENRVKISNSIRITRILQRICEATLPVIVRTTGAGSVSIKGRATDLTNYGTDATPAMRISNVSERGVVHLLSTDKVQIEFVMMSTKVAFVSRILAREEQSILVSIPLALISIERRKNARYVCSDELRAFTNLSCWKPDLEDLTAPPFYPHSRNIAGYLSLSDISFGGFCVSTRFPSSFMQIRRGIIDDKAKLILPMIGIFEVGIEVRWIKRIKEHSKDSDGHDRFKRIYKFGVAFVSQSESLKVGLRQFLSQLSQAGAI